MNVKELAQLVLQMRQAQRAYFRDRSPQLLSAAKEAERAVDRTLERLPTADQAKMFQE